MKERESQKEIVFYLLYQSYLRDPNDFVPVHSFAAGDILIKELHRWAFASFKCPARASEIYNENPGLLDRRVVHGRSGAHYYAYRIAPSPKAALIKDEKLLTFYKKISVVYNQSSTI